MCDVLDPGRTHLRRGGMAELGYKVRLRIPVWGEISIYCHSHSNAAMQPCLNYIQTVFLILYRYSFIQLSIYCCKDLNQDRPLYLKIMIIEL
ncbi:hypothetical protein CBS147317_5675 [Penicillium roqueforti]|nr:hypothetical protein CBS147337_2250 [Penicillium roqueforti]KAI2704418.1 hypothetical protein CBS147372_2887 [Penicillium roqueforti]KAI3130237.1 hypothetical protein CBS147330_5002 [Penicillium roqueforti]KAI3136804.1 hypothetical protein CBS147326_3913 [Penicillium roqueforti]KAI3155804.1 hypothetical protein CBS147317_5675 [Penicillium roqueforti]